MSEGAGAAERPLKILSLDGGGAKGFYTLGVLREIEGLVGKPLCEEFDLVFGTSTGAIIAALISLGFKVNEIHDLYREHVPRIMKAKRPGQKSTALGELADLVFRDKMFADVKTGVGIVTTKWEIERPMMFKGSIAQAHGRKGTFVPGFGVRISDAVQASCSAYPFFQKKVVHTDAGDDIVLVDGGYCANNPTIYAIADGTRALGREPADLRVVSVGVGVYPEPKRNAFDAMRWAKYLQSVQLLQKTLEINTQSMDQLCAIMFKHVPTVRINDTFDKPEMATDLFEHDMQKLNLLRQRGAESYARDEEKIKALLGG